MANKTCKTILMTDGADQISTFPDDVLVRILSLVPTEDAVTTSILSKRWKFLWTLIPVLDFDYLRFSEKFNALTLIDQKRRFLEFVEHVLFRHELQPLEKLRLAFDITKFDEYISKASMLVKLAMRSNCLTIDLEFCNHGPYSLLLTPRYDKLYTLPPCFFPHQSVSQMKLTNCQFTPSLYRNFTSVNIAKITNVALQKDSVYDLVSQCPCLEELHLIKCKISSLSFKLKAPKSNLKCLVVQSCVGNKWCCHSFMHASIHIPTLSKLKYKGSFGLGYLSLYNSENIIEAEIDINSRPPPNKLCEILMSLQNVKSLTLFSVKLEDINGGISLLTPLNNLKHLTVQLRQTDTELLGLMCLLSSSHRLETLSIDCFQPNFETEDEMLFAVDNVDEEAVRQLHLLSSECVAPLMKIKITGFLGIKVQMEFVENILRSSLCLKEMVIRIGSRYYQNFDISIERYEALNKKTIARLLACTRASHDAKILLEDVEYFKLSQGVTMYMPKKVW